MVIEGREWPLGFLANAVLGPKYSCTDICLIEDSESPIHVFEHCRTRCVCGCACMHLGTGKMKERE